MTGNSYVYPSNYKLIFNLWKHFTNRRQKQFLLLLCFCLPLFSQENIKNEKITVLINKFPPLVIQEQDKYMGFDIDLWNEICCAVGVISN